MSYKGIFKSCHNEQLKTLEDKISREFRSYQLLVENLKKPGTLISCLDISHKWLSPFADMIKTITIDRDTVSTYFSILNTDTSILFSPIGIEALEDLKRLFTSASALTARVEIYIANYQLENNRPSLNFWIDTILESNAALGAFISCYLEEFPHTNEEKKQNFYLQNLHAYFKECLWDIEMDIKYLKSLKYQIYNLITETTNYRKYLFLTDLKLIKLKFSRRYEISHFS